jgi:spore coat protein CotH
LSNRWYIPVLTVFFSVLLAAVSMIGALFETDRTRHAMAIGSADALEQNLDQQIFPKERVIDVRITVDENDFQDMLENALAEEIKPASVEYNGIKMDNIGFRTKGNLSLTSVARSDSDRYSFKLSFDEYITSQKLFGVSKINLNNSYGDRTYLREVLAYELAERLGLPVPKYSFVNLYINDELWGLYLAVEQIDTAYLERNFGDATGSLYKAVQGAGTELAWFGESRDAYVGLVQKSDRAADDALIHMIDVLNNGTDYEEVLDVSNILKYIALNVATSNWDSYIGQNKHNYYLYEQNGVFSILPWDFNLAFGGNIMPFGGGFAGNRPPDGGFNGNIPFEGSFGENISPNGGFEGNMPPDNGFGGNMPRGGGFGGNFSIESPAGNLERPLVSRLLAVDAYKEEYFGYIREALQGYLAPETFNKRVDEWVEWIRPYVRQDPRPFYSYDEYESGIEDLKTTNANRVTELLQQLEEIAQNNKSAGGELTVASAMPVARNGMEPPQNGGQADAQDGAQGDARDGAQGGAQGGAQSDAQGGAQGDAQVGIQGGTQGGVLDGGREGQGNAQWGRRGGGMPWQQGDMGGGAAQIPQAPGGADAGGARPFPGGGGFPGNFPGGNLQNQGAGAFTADPGQNQTEEFYATVISLGLMTLAAIFILTYKRRRI